MVALSAFECPKILIADFCKTWGYMAQMTPAYVSHDMDEVSVLIWDFQWESLTYERQTTLIADYQALTGKAWTGPQPTPPSVYTPRSAMTTIYAKPGRAMDTRNGNGLAGKFTGGVSRKLQIAGRDLPCGDGSVFPVPSNAVGITGNITVTNPAGGGYAVALTPVPTTPVGTSALNFANGQTVGNGFSIGLDVDGTVSIALLGPAGATADLILDVTSADVP
jgi:hypothetical protein